MITAKDAANIAANYNLSTARTMESVEKTITSAAAYGNNFVTLDKILIPHEVLCGLIDNGYHIEAYHGTIIVSWDNEIVEKKMNNIANTLGLNLTTNDISNYHRLSSAEEINNRYHDNRIKDIASANVEVWFSKYVYSNIDRFSNAISCGTKFTIQDGIYNAEWVVVGADTEIGKGDTPFAKPHLSLIPVTNLGEAQMNDMGTISTYADSKMYRETIPAIVKALQKVLGNHLLARRVKLSNNIDNGHPNSSAYYTVYANLMCVRQISGNLNHIYENGYDIGDDAIPLPGLSKYKDKICESFDFWLRSVYNNDLFVCLDRYGGIDVYDGTAPYGVRPLITIG